MDFVVIARMSLSEAVLALLGVMIAIYVAHDVTAGRFWAIGPSFYCSCLWQSPMLDFELSTIPNDVILPEQISSLLVVIALNLHATSRLDIRLDRAAVDRECEPHGVRLARSGHPDLLMVFELSRGRVGDRDQNFLTNTTRQAALIGILPDGALHVVGIQHRRELQSSVFLRLRGYSE